MMGLIPYGETMKNITQEQKKELFPDNCVLMTYRGSVAHNMYVPNTDPNSIDDIDMMGVYLAPTSHYVGLFPSKEVEEKFIGKYDVVSYEFRKLVGMLLKSNPNVLGMLWLRENHYLHKTDVGQLLIDNREIFVSKLAYKSFTGYAYSQLKRMTHNANEGYMGAKRKALVEKYGYDCKNAAHCIRLLRMGMEFLVTGEVNVFREDAPQLLEIKLGKWKLEQVKAEAERLFKLADEAFIHSKLPNQPNKYAAEMLVADVLSNHVTTNYESMEASGAYKAKV